MDEKPQVSTTSRFDQCNAVKSSRLPRSRRASAVRGNPPTFVTIKMPGGFVPEIDRNYCVCVLWCGIMHCMIKVFLYGKNIDSF